tara:strand:- start:102 stop:524 length:423 start_codon:yes stop_codon:yes gene_type:complete
VIIKKTTIRNFLVLYLCTGTAVAGVCSFSAGDYLLKVGTNVELVRDSDTSVMVYPSDSSGKHLGSKGNHYSYKVVAASGNNFRAINFTHANHLPSKSWLDVEYGGELFFTFREQEASRLVISFLSPDFLDQSSVTTFLCH